jgi:hypothetical protein
MPSNPAASREWRKNNPERSREYTKAWRAANREKVRAAQKAWRERNKQRPSVVAQQYRDRIRQRGLEPEEYERLLADQGGRCAICRSDSPRRKNAQTLYIDHCHATGRVRGLLCMACNSVLGFARDSADVLRGALEYLARVP